MTDPLAKLFGSDARIKLLRLFLFNPQQSFSAPEAARHARVSDVLTRKELVLFCSVGLVKIIGRKRIKRYQLREDFTHLAPLKNLLLNAPTRGQDIYERIRKVGTLKLVVVAGIFVGEWEGRLDLLVVGDKVKEPRLRTAVRKLESELGKELRYASLSSENFLYRLNMNDKLIRDVFDYPHIIVFDRLNIGLK